MHDYKYYNIVNKENRAEIRDIKRTALAAARATSNPARRQEKYNAIMRPAFALTGEIINSPIY